MDAKKFYSLIKGCSTVELQNKLGIGKPTAQKLKHGYSVNVPVDKLLDFLEELSIKNKLS